jgi:hypothetical protein
MKRLAFHFSLRALNPQASSMQAKKRRRRSRCEDVVDAAVDVAWSAPCQTFGTGLTDAFSTRRTVSRLVPPGAVVHAANATHLVIKFSWPAMSIMVVDITLFVQLAGVSGSSSTAARRGARPTGAPGVAVGSTVRRSFRRVRSNI